MFHRSPTTADHQATRCVANSRPRRPNGGADTVLLAPVGEKTPFLELSRRYCVWPRMADKREWDMRAFLEACGLRGPTIESAIDARRKKPLGQAKKPHPMKGKKQTR